MCSNVLWPWEPRRLGRAVVCSIRYIPARPGGHLVPGSPREASLSPWPTHRACGFGRCQIMAGVKRAQCASSSGSLRPKFGTIQNSTCWVIISGLIAVSENCQKPHLCFNCFELGEPRRRGSAIVFSIRGIPSRSRGHLVDGLPRATSSLLWLTRCVCGFWECHHMAGV